MAEYKLSRNVEKSIIDYLTAELATDGWTGIFVEKVFAQIYSETNPSFPAILVAVSNRPEKRREVGSSSLSGFVNLEIRVFATGDGLRLDLSDFLLEKIMPGIPYYAYTITSGVVSEKTLAGRIVILEITANRKELVNLTGLAIEDKFRHLLSLRARVSLS